MFEGEKMTEEECEQLFQGHEDAQGNIHYEGSRYPHITYCPYLLNLLHLPCTVDVIHCY